MSNLVDSSRIERIVGAARLNSQHLARAVSSEQTVYILHSWMCVKSGVDLRGCPFSLALDRGIDEYDWSDMEDRAVQVVVRDGRLVPVRRP